MNLALNVTICKAECSLMVKFFSFAQQFNKNKFSKRFARRSKCNHSKYTSNSHIETDAVVCVNMIDNRKALIKIFSMDPQSCCTFERITLFKQLLRSKEKKKMKKKMELQSFSIIRWVCNVFNVHSSGIIDMSVHFLSC